MAYLVSAAKPDLPTDKAGKEHRQGCEHAHVEQPEMAGVLPELVLREQRGWHQMPDVDSRRCGRITPARGHQPGQLVQTESAGDRNHSPPKPQLGMQGAPAQRPT